MKKQLSILGNTVLGAALLTAITLSVNPAQAQSDIRAGVKVGLNASSLTFKGNPASKEAFGLQGGLFAQIPVGSSFAIQPELLYSVKGVKIEYTLPVYNEVNTLNLSYVEIPVLATYKVGSMIEIQAGPYAAYLLSAKINSGGFFGDQAVGAQDIESYNKFDYGLAGGVNAYVGKLVIGLRYAQGLTKVTKSDVFLAPYFGDARNVVGTISVGYSFN